MFNWFNLWIKAMLAYALSSINMPSRGTISNWFCSSFISPVSALSSSVLIIHRFNTSDKTCFCHANSYMVILVFDWAKSINTSNGLGHINPRAIYHIKSMVFIGFRITKTFIYCSPFTIELSSVQFFITNLFFFYNFPNITLNFMTLSERDSSGTTEQARSAAKVMERIARREQKKQHFKKSAVFRLWSGSPKLIC